MEAKKKDEAPVLSKEVAPLLLAFLNGWFDVLCFRQYKAFTLRQTGSTMNLAINLHLQDSVNIKFFFAILANYCGGCAIFKFLDTLLKGRNPLTASAPVVLALQMANDRLRNAFPDVRWHMSLLAMSNGLFNTAAAEKFACLTHVITGHYQKLSTDLVLLGMKGLSKDQLRATRKSVCVLIAFFSGAFIGQAAGNLKHAIIPHCSKHRFGILGVFYAALLVLSELPASQLFGSESSSAIRATGETTKQA